MTGDWVFVDWADGYLDKKGELLFEQILFCRSLETMALCAELVGDANSKQKYEKLAAALKAKLEPASGITRNRHLYITVSTVSKVMRSPAMRICFLSSFNI
jgi:hypothetical protein